MTLRIMTWNCHGMAEKTKQEKLLAYVEARKIDCVFLQEGAENFLESEHESHESRNDLFPRADMIGTNQDKGAVVEMFRQRGSDQMDPHTTLPMSRIRPIGGVASRGYYNVFSRTPGLIVRRHNNELCDYAGNPHVMNWVFRPGQGAAAALNYQEPPPGSRKRTAASQAPADARKVREPVQLRANMLAQRRPKAVTVKDGANQRTIHYWHAPQGPGVELAQLGLPGDTGQLAQEGIGQVAVAASLLFRLAIYAGNAMPANTLLVGDLNVRPKGVADIYGGVSVASLDGLCHAVAPAGTTFKLLPEFGTKASTEALTTSLGGSDHHPIVFDVTFKD